jgi:SPP1 gp7 family putative phage head morphogenesis protein
VDDEKEPIIPIIPQVPQEDGEGTPFPTQDPKKEIPKEIPKEIKEQKLFSLKRQPNKYEKKMDFKQVANDLDEVGSKAVDDMEKIVLEMEDSITEQVKKGKFATLKDIEDLNLKYWGDFRITLKDYFRKVFKLGMRKAKIIAKGYRVVKRTGAGLDMSNALEFFDNRAFTITGLEKTKLETEVKEVLRSGLKNGWSTKDVIKDIQGKFYKYQNTPEVLDEIDTPWRLETIVRTNFIGAYNYGLNAEWGDNNFVEAYEWSSILDERTTDYCEAMDGEIFAKDDPSLSLPPAHFNCRSIIVPIMLGEDYTLSGLNPEAPNGIERQLD